MNVQKLAMQVIPVMIGVFLIGLTMNALRSNDLVNNAINGFDG